MPSGWKPFGSAIVAGKGAAVDDEPAPAASRPTATNAPRTRMIRDVFMRLGYPEPWLS
jgi:hypothetical protein